MPQQHELQDQTNQTLPVIRGFAEPSTSAHQWDFPLQDTPYSDLQAEAHQVEEDSQEEVIPAEAVVSQEEEDQEDPLQILWEDIKETD